MSGDKRPISSRLKKAVEYDPDDSLGTRDIWLPTRPIPKVLEPTRYIIDNGRTVAITLSRREAVMKRIY